MRPPREAVVTWAKATVPAINIVTTSRRLLKAFFISKRIE
jgi:hypothetical protein